MLCAWAEEVDRMLCAWAEEGDRMLCAWACCALGQRRVTAYAV